MDRDRRLGLQNFVDSGGLSTADTSNIFLELKREIRRALLESEDADKPRFSFLEEENDFGETMIINDKKNDIKIRIVFDRDIESVTSMLMAEYIKLDQRLNKLIVFFKNWRSEHDDTQPILGSRLSELSLKCMLIAYM